jgi:hypothetical protein
MGPARRLEDRARLPLRLVKPVEPGIGVGLQDTGEAVEVALGMLARAVLRVEEYRGRRIRPGEGAVVADVGPHPARPRPALGQNRDRRVIAMHPLGGEHVGADEIVERPQRHAAGANPVGQRRQAEVDPFTRVALALPVERLMLAVLLEQDHGE